MIFSFEEFEIEYKYLKAVIEGGLEKKPDNILIYATSNRRAIWYVRHSKIKLTEMKNCIPMIPNRETFRW